MQEVITDRMAPAFFYRAVNQVIDPVHIHQPIGIVQPVRIRRKMELRAIPLFIHRVFGLRVPTRQHNYEQCD